MDRLLVVRCPELLEEDEGGASLRQFIQVIGAVEAYCPWVTVVRPGICSLPARGPARYFGGEEALVVLLAAVAAEVTPVEVGIADGLFAAVLAARAGRVVPAGKTREFLGPFPVEALGNSELAELLARLGLRTIGDFASLPEPHVLGRFGADGVVCHLVASGQSGELSEPGELRLSATGRRVDRLRNGGSVGAGQSGFWGGVSDTDARAARALAAVQHLLGPDSVVTVRLQGGRSPSEQARFVTWNAHEAPDTSAVHAPWPGRIPPPAPATVHAEPLPAELVDGTGTPVAVSGRGLLTASPDRLSVERHPWTAVTAWAGPWPTDERWWSRSRRRSARMQVVTGAHARLLLAERGRWWVEATYD
jgi:nucleotidyltransferase/DNA polymerase involved in DNA repair